MIVQGLVADATDLGADGAISIYRVRVVPISGGMAKVFRQVSPPVILFFLPVRVGLEYFVLMLSVVYNNLIDVAEAK